MRQSIIDHLPKLAEIESELARKRREADFLRSLRRLIKRQASREELVRRIAEQRVREGIRSD